MTTIKNHYLITRKTMMLTPEYTDEANTIIKEEGNSFLAKPCMKKILNDSCLVNGASFIGRMNFAKNCLMTDKKLPVGVIPHANVIMFPVGTGNIFHKVWLAYNHIIDFREISQGRMELLFTDQSTSTITISRHSFRRQYNLAAQLTLKHTYNC
ncbi:competence protein ComK [Thalassobacillus pellis]|uniref:competence protein ComK n=1 Tax=Thalassobacillus pellis TaxID=748008 RepID=UPI00195F5A7D|nr:competence protein ComK [Thalassobacillus pellis]MBM7551728.1 competence protein ComK [Thalassobacillus pellis]